MVKSALKQGETVQIPGLGTFTPLPNGSIDFEPWSNILKALNPHDPRIPPNPLEDPDGN